MSTTYNTRKDESLIEYQTVKANTTTVSQWVDAFNNNAIAGQQFITYLGLTLANSVFIGPSLGISTPSIGKVPVSSLTNLANSFTNVSPDNLELDNFYLYFRNINQILLLDQKTFDITDYADGKMHLFYINSDLGFRISDIFDQRDDEILLFRFILNTNLRFQQVYCLFQRFGTSVYDGAWEYYQVNGCVPQQSASKLKLSLTEGFIKRSGLRFDIHENPDIFIIEDNSIPFPLRYVEADNTIDYSKDTTDTVISNKVLNYYTKSLSTITDGKFTVQRVLFDVYERCLILQYGDSAYDTMEQALTSIQNITYPYPYDTNYRPLFIPIGLIFIESGATDLSDADQAVFVQQTTQTTLEQDSTLFAEDAYARGRIAVIREELDRLHEQVDTIETTLRNHMNDKSNPHQVTKAQVGLGNVDNYSFAKIKELLIGVVTNDTLDDRYVNVTGDTMTGGLTINHADGLVTTGRLTGGQNYITLNGVRLYLGTNPSSISGMRNGDYAIYYE